MLHAGSSHDGRTYIRLAQHPRESFLSHCASILTRYTFEVVDYGFVLCGCLFRPYHRRNSVNLCTCCLCPPWVCTSSARKRTPWINADFAIKAQRHHFVFFFPVYEVVLVLHRYEFRPVMTLRNVLQSLELPRVHCAGSYVPCFAGLHNIMKCLHNLFHRRECIKAVNLVQVDVIKSQAFEAVIYFGHDVFA